MYVYHRRPPGFRGQHLLPLNQLKSEHPDLYEQYIKKYEGREQVLENRIPHLECFWNDVIHLSPIHPSILRELLVSFEISTSPNDWFKIPIQRLFAAKNAVRWYTNRGKSRPDDYFETFDVDRYQELQVAPAETVSYYRDCGGSQKKPLLFVGVPHVLVLGAIHIEGLEVFSWDSART